MSSYLSRIEGPPPKRNAPGSNPGEDATKNAESLVSQGFRLYFFFEVLDCPARIFLCELSVFLRLQTLYSKKILLIKLAGNPHFC